MTNYHKRLIKLMASNVSVILIGNGAYQESKPENHHVYGIKDCYLSTITESLTSQRNLSVNSNLLYSGKHVATQIRSVM